MGARDGPTYRSVGGRTKQAGGTLAETNATVRERIMEVATRLFGQQGYAATSVRQVVQEAGVTKPTLYYYFEGKEGLFREVVRARMLALEALIADTLECASLDAVERLRQFMARMVREGLDDTDSLRLMTLVFAPVGAESLPEHDAGNVTIRVVQAIATALEAGEAEGRLALRRDPISVALSILGACNTHTWAGVLGWQEAASQAEDLFDLFLHGVQAR